jgi:hypothetical protein
MANRVATFLSNIKNQSRLENSDALIPETWKSLTSGLAAGWVAFNVAGFQNPQYRKDPMGVVQLRGGIKQTTPAAVAQSAVLATLPLGYRPLNAVTLPAVSINGSSVVSAGAIIIQPSGEVQAYSTTLHGTYVSLDGLTFSTV